MTRVYYSDGRKDSIYENVYCALTDLDNKGFEIHFFGFTQICARKCEQNNPIHATIMEGVI